jgi:hypothetical protein
MRFSVVYICIELRQLQTVVSSYLCRCVDYAALGLTRILEVKLWDVRCCVLYYIGDQLKLGRRF